MTATPEIQDQIKRYLLGELDDGTRAQVEQKLLSDGEVFEELLVAEDEIIDDYASGRLDLEERADFEAHFLATPDRQQKLRFARALHRHAMTLANELETVKRPVIRSLWSSRPWLSWVATTVAVLAPATQLKRGQYALTLFRTGGDSGEQRLPGRYLFTVE